MTVPPPPEHVVPAQRDNFELKVGMTYCRRCGRPIVNDRYPDRVTIRPCQEVRVGLRDTHRQPCAEVVEAAALQLYDLMGGRRDNWIVEEPGLRDKYRQLVFDLVAQLPND